VRLLTAMILVTGFAVTAAIVAQTVSNVGTEARRDFDLRAERLSIHISDRLSVPIYGLRSVVALYAAEPNVSRAEFEAFIDSRDLPSEFPQVMGFGFIERVIRADLPQFLARERADGVPDFKVTTSGDAADLYVIKHIFPRAVRPEFWGYDIGSDKTRGDAAELAIRTGQPTVSRRVSLRLGQGQKKGFGFLLMMPVYTNGPEPRTPEERLSRLRGLIYAPLAAEQMFGTSEAVTDGMINLEIFDDADPRLSNLIYHDGIRPAGADPVTNDDYRGQSFLKTTQLKVGVRTLTMRMRTTPKFEATINRSRPWMVGALGSVSSMLLALLGWSLGRSRARALVLALESRRDLRTSEAEARRLALVVRETHNAVIITDRHGYVDWVNDGFTRISGYTIEEVRGRTPGSLLQGRDTDPATVATMREALAAGAGFNVEIVNYHKCGQPYWVAIEVRVMRDELGEPLQFMAIESDITQRKLADAELRAAIRLQTAILESAAHAVVATDAEGLITLWNQAAERLLGYAAIEVIGRHTAALIHDAAEIAARASVLSEELGVQIAPGFEVIAARCRRGLPEEREWTYIRKDASRVPVNLAFTALLDDHGQVAGFIGLASDISARRDAEERLMVAMADAQQSAFEAERANLAKSEFLATMSHEIRTPMNGVIGMTSLLLDTALAPQQRDYTEVIRSSGEALLALINDILDFSKIESGHLEMEKAVFGVADCLESVLDIVTLAAASKGLELNYQVDAAVPIQLEGDVTRLRQVLLNLVTNAVKFTEKGEVELSVRTLGCIDGQHELLVAVRDTGIGIPAEAQSRLFRSFSQVDASTTRKYGGTGLGLAISRRLVELMGGKLWVESAAGQGSTFQFSLRLSAPSRALIPVPLPALIGRRLLVVDDNATSRKLLARMAERWNMQAVTAGDAAEAEAHVRDSRAFDAILIDAEMPDMDGVSLARQLRGLRGAGCPPMILLRSRGRREAASDMDLFAATLHKPARPSQLYDVLVSSWGEAANKTAATPGAVNAMAAPSCRRERILLAEDNLVNQKVALHMLARLGYRADVVANGVEALEALTRQHYDVVLMDMQMPEMDGIEATRRILARWPDRATRPWIIALTANAMGVDKARCLAAGMDDFLAKPISREALTVALARAGETADRLAPA